MTGAATATLLRPKQETIPSELKARNQWVMWRRESREGKSTKVPYFAPDRRASSTDPATWLSFDTAWALYECDGFDGVGYVFAADDPYCGIDLDPELPESDRQTILQRFGSYTERSPSDQGQHIIVKATLPGGGRKRGPLEVYDRARYFTVTGHVIEGALPVIEEQQEAVDWLLATYFSQQRDTKSNTNGGGLDVTGGDLLARAFDAANGDKLRRLWNGDATDYPSASEADMALASLLAFWTGPDAMKLETLMRGSGLAREKWDKRHYGDGQTYLEGVVTKALSGRIEFYTAGNGHATASAEAAAPWPEPKPIVAPLHPVPLFDSETLLPDALRAWIMDEADRMPCPPDFIAVGAMVAMGAIIGARCAIKPKFRDDWLIVPNLWGGIVGLPAAKKSPAIAAALKPLDRLIARAMETQQSNLGAFDVDKTVFEAKKEAIEARIKAAAKGKDAKQDDLDKIAKEFHELLPQAPEAPTPRRYKTNDTTIEKLGELLRDNPAGVLVLRDELVGLVASWEREGREGDRAFFLEAWNGNSRFDTDRIGRGNISIPNLCVSIFGGIQPDKLITYLEQATHALANDGMLQRFQLMVYPDHRAWEWRDRTPDKVARDRASAVYETLADFDPVTWGAAPVDDFAKFPHFHFDEAAQEIFIEWSSDLHLMRLPAEEHPIIAQHLTKFDKLFPALALILHLADCQRGPVTAVAAYRAAAWCDYLEAHARRCYGLLADNGLRAAQALAYKIRQRKLLDGFTARGVRRNQWRHLTGDKEVQAALDWLEDEGWLRSTDAGTVAGGGRPTLVYRINPAVKFGNKSGGDHGELA